MPWLMGQGVGLIHDIEPTAELVREMMEQAKWMLAGFGGWPGKGADPLGRRAE
ncbi:hypothetical protein [Nonomuraea sp. NPDC003709]|uniref:hypothetical protein n=1 Tax=Nonomuraea sp. NPDC003709 TaxID=3154450 RepID=UPI0033AAD65D